MSRVGPTLARRVAHFDLDTFFVAVERARDPELVGKPVLVGGRGRRAVVAAASYESRRFGCHSAQPMTQALRLCPQAIVLPPDRGEYSRVSRLFHELLRDLSPVVESVGIDEAYVDFTGIGDPVTGAAAAAEATRARVRSELDIAVSVCIAGSRTTAKVGSDRAKPDGLIEVPPGADAAFLAPLPVRDLPLVGPRLADALAAAGVHSIGDIAGLDARWLEQRFGRMGLAVLERARGEDPTPVRAGARPNRSVSREVTFGEDVTDRAELHRVLARHAERVGADLRRDGRRARTVTLKLRWNDFTTLTRSRTLARPAQSTVALVEPADALLEELVGSEGMRPVRLIGLGASNLVEDVLQLEFGDLLDGEAGAAVDTGGPLRDERLDRALDEIRDRFGDAAVSRGL